MSERRRGQVRLPPAHLVNDKEGTVSGLRATAGLLRDVVGTAPYATAALATASVVRAVAAVALPAVLAGAVRTVVEAGDSHRPLTVLVVLAVAAALAEAVLLVSSGRLTARAGVLLRRRLTDAVLRSGPAATDRLAPGDLTARVVNNVDQAATVVPSLLGVVVAFGTGLAAVVAIASYDPWLGLLVLLALPVLVRLTRGFLARSTEQFLRYQVLQSGIAGGLAEALGGVRTIRSAGTTDREIDRVLGPLPELAGAGRATWTIQRDVLWRAGLLVPMAEVVVLAAAGAMVGAGRLSAPDLLAVAGYVMLALGSLAQVDAVLGLGQISATGRRIAEVVAAAPGPDGELPGVLPPGPGEVLLRGIRVGPPEAPALRIGELRIPAGAAVALVGRAGSGKSLLAALLGRLVEPDAGEVRLDGVPLASVRAAAVRREVAYAFERPALLGGTLRGLIGYGGPGRAADAELTAAATIAGADGFVRRLPDGYDTPLARAPLSGGELQRLGVAQAVARDCRLLVLDDATSSLDTLTEKQVSEAITAGLAGRTRVLVARRPATAAAADVVVWLEGGVVRATGRHEELVGHPGYRQLFADRDVAS